jgi:hypothetical protein
MGSVKETELIKDVLNFSLSVSLERFSIALQETADGT